MQIAAEHGDEQAVSTPCRRRGRARPSPDERAFYLFAPARFRDPRIIDRALQRTLSSDVRTQDTARYLAAFFDNPVARPRAWSFVKSQLDRARAEAADLQRRSGSPTRWTRSATAARATTSERSSTRNRLPGMTGALNQAIERINNCIDLREKQTQPVSDWLAVAPD